MDMRTKRQMQKRRGEGGKMTGGMAGERKTDRHRQRACA